MKKIIYLIFFINLFTGISALCQVISSKPLPTTKEQVLEMSYDDLMALSFEDLIGLAEIMGVSPDELMEMILNKTVSSASKSNESLLESPLSATVISKDEIVKSGATSIMEVLRLVPGMIVREKTPGNFDIHIRGNDNVPPKNMMLYSENAMSLVMINGRPVYNYSFGGSFWETLPIEVNDIERIEVVRGPSSALYGPNAVTGVINIITLKPETSKPSFSGNAQMGSPFSQIYNGGISGGIGNKFKYRVSGNFTDRNRFETDYYLWDTNRKVKFSDFDTLTNYWDDVPQNRSNIAEVNYKEKFTDSTHATNKWGANAFLFYDLNSRISFNLSAGIQESDVVTSILGNSSMSVIGRASNTKYIDFLAKVYGFTFQSNYLYGSQPVEKGIPGWTIDPHIFNAQLEYEYRLNKLVLRPGVSYQHTMYTDKEHIDVTKREGFLNGDKVLTGTAGFLRAEYKPIEPLRLIAAVRAEKYNIPDKTYLTWQLVGTYKFNENNLVRGVYSRANRGSFIVDSHSNYLWNVIPGYYSLEWYGNKNLKLPTMDMFELGCRFRPVKNIMIDLEAFQTTTKDFSYFLPDSMVLNVDYLNQTNTIKGAVNYYNFDLKTIQQGLTFTTTMVVNTKLNFKVFGTLQQTKIEGFYPKTIWQNFSEMQTLMTSGQFISDYTIMNIAASGGSLTTEQQTRYFQLLGKGLKESYGAANPDLVNGKINPDSLENTTNKATPSFYGGFAVDFSPNAKLNIYTSAYYFSSNEIYTNSKDKSDNKNAQEYYQIDPKFLLNLKVGYKVWRNCSVFVNARNALNTSQREFAYMEAIKGTYLIGTNINF